MEVKALRVKSGLNEPSNASTICAFVCYAVKQSLIVCIALSMEVFVFRFSSMLTFELTGHWVNSDVKLQMSLLSS